jgi:hypothetical protein
VKIFQVAERMEKLLKHKKDIRFFFAHLCVGGENTYSMYYFFLNSNLFLHLLQVKALFTNGVRSENGSN